MEPPGPPCVTFCIYALADENVGRIALRGLSGERLRKVRVGRIVAVVGEMRRRPAATEANLRQYDRIVSALWERTSALLPARYGSYVADLEELGIILGSRQAPLRRRLRQVRHRVQMTLRIPVTERPAAEAPPVLASRSDSGADYLRSRARASALAARVPRFDPVRGAVRRWVRAEQVDMRGAIATVYHLIPRGAVNAYRRALAAKAETEHVRLVISGPWPPYAFAGDW